MNEEKAREILGDAIRSDDSLSIRRKPKYLYMVSFGEEIQLDGEYKIEELEAIVWWMKNEKQI